jgi:hypothetical protein
MADKLRSAGVFDELVKVFCGPTEITELLDEMGVPMSERQLFVPGQTAKSYWDWLWRKLADGRIEGLPALLQAAHKLYRGNPIFRHWALVGK